MLISFVSQMLVEEMNILTTVFMRYDNQKIIYPNSVLSMRPIANYYRSPDMGESIDFCVHIATPMEKIATMKDKIRRYKLQRHIDLFLFFSFSLSQTIGKQALCSCFELGRVRVYCLESNSNYESKLLTFIFGHPLICKYIYFI